LRAGVRRRRQYGSDGSGDSGAGWAEWRARCWSPSIRRRRRRLLGANGNFLSRSSIESVTPSSAVL
jgi:hypothetical protein